MKNRGLYNQAEGNETNPNAFAERLVDNEAVEGPEVKRLNAAAKRQDWAAIERITTELKVKGWSQSRIDSVLRQAMFKVKL
tara:strand:+ start:3057 stop:3299 length:243 start_codon:yes stop_codon:yes gene_type:complete